MTLAGHLVELANTTLYVESHGSGPAVVLLHGLALDHRTWDPQVIPLGREHRVVRFDLHGFGRSSPVRDPYSHGAIIKELFERLGIERAHLVGHSMGGRVAAEFVQCYPELALSLTLVDADIAGLPFGGLRSSFAAIFEAGRRGEVDAAKHAFLELACFAATRRRPEASRALERMVNDYSGWLFRNIGANPEIRPTPATAEVLEQFRLPVLVVVGELDAPDFHDIADQVLRRTRGSRKLVLHAAGHLPNLETPGPFNEALLEFLRGGKA